MNKNSSRIWLPVVERLGIMSPKTIVVPYDHHEAVGFLDEQGDPGPLVAKVQDACRKIGYPCFLRTDLASAKHDGPDAYMIGSPSQAFSRIMRTVEDNELKFWLERHGPSAFLVREFLDLDAPFTAFRNLPIAREWRIFADKDRVLCAHPYWPKEALEGHVNAPAGWSRILDSMHEPPEDVRDLHKIAVSVAAAIGGAWSVDFAMDKKGTWWLIDCATAEDSWHWPGCPTAVIQERHDHGI